MHIVKHCDDPTKCPDLTTGGCPGHLVEIPPSVITVTPCHKCAALRERCAKLESELALRATIIRDQRRVAVEAATWLRSHVARYHGPNGRAGAEANALADRLESQS